MKKKILITGASGMVARELIVNLSKYDEYKVYAASRNRTNYQEPTCNILNSQIEKYLQEEEFDCLVHCAFPRNVDETKWASGIDFGIQVLFLAKKYRVRRIVHISSQSIYGWNRNVPAREENPVCLNNAYGTGKYCTEVIVDQLFSDILHTNIRLATVIGEETEERVPNKLIRQLINGENLIIQGGNQIFSFLDIRDVGKALCELVLRDQTCWRSIYNIGTEECHSLLEIAEMCLSIARKNGNKKSGIELLAKDIFLNNQLDCSAFQNDFEWRAEYRLSETLERIYQKYLQKSL